MDINEGPYGVFTSAGYYIDLNGVSEATAAVNGLVASGNSVVSALGSTTVSPAVFAQIGSAVGSAGSMLDAHLNTGLSGVMSDLGTTNSGIKASLAAYVTLDQAIAQGYGGLQSGTPTTTGSGQSATQPQADGQPPSGLLDDVAYHPPQAATQAQVNQWIQQAIRVMEAHGIPASQLNQQDIATIIQHESSNIPTNVNTWDRNWAEGHPSQGLMQVIPSTFARYSLPGYNTNIQDPVSNIIAGTRYALHKYGSLSNVPGIVGLRNGGGYIGY